MSSTAKQTGLRFQEVDLKAIKRIKDHYKFPTDTAAIRFALHQFVATLPAAKTKASASSR